MPAIRTVLVGSKFIGRDAINGTIALREGDLIRLRREPDNKVDSRAVACDFNGAHLGYIPTRQNADMGAALDAGRLVTCVVTAEAITVNGGIREVPRLVVSW